MRVTIDAPVALVAGKVVPYTITLANATDAPIALEPCPSYGQSIGMFRALLRLNCGEAVDVPPKGSETFAMRFRVPSSAAPGPSQLTWNLATHAENDVLVRSDVTIVNERYDGPSAPTGCTTEGTEPPCGPGMVAGHEYPFMAGVHCEFRGLFADGRPWVPEGGSVGDGNGNPPPGWGNSGDLGVVTLQDAGRLVFESSTGQRVPMRPRRPDDPEEGSCA